MLSSPPCLQSLRSSNEALERSMVLYSSLATHLLVSVATVFSATTFHIPSYFLLGLQSFFLPEPSDYGDPKASNNTMDGARVSKSSSKRKERRKESLELNDGSSQIIRIHLGISQIEGGMYYKQYDEAIVCAMVGIVNLLAHEFLLQTGSVHEDLIPFLICVFAAARVAWLLVSVSWERSSYQGFDHLLSFSVAFFGFLVAISILYLLPEKFIDFGFKGFAITDLGNLSEQNLRPFLVFRSLVKFMLAIIAGCLTGIILVPAHKSVRSFWLGTDQAEWNISLTNAGRMAQLLLYLNVVMPLFTSTLWIRPMAELFIRESPFQTCSPIRHGKPVTYGGLDSIVIGKDQSEADYPSTVDLDNAETVYVQKGKEECGNDAVRLSECKHEHMVGQIRKKMDKLQCRSEQSIVETKDFHSPTIPGTAEGWFEKIGMSEYTFAQFRIFCLLLTGLLQLFLLRVNLQMYLNSGLLMWYESLHRSRVINLDVIRAKLILNSYFLLRVSLQFLAPGTLIILLLGSARALADVAGNSDVVSLSYFCSIFRVAAVFMAWWIAFGWAALTCTILALYRVGFFSVLQ